MKKGLKYYVLAWAAALVLVNIIALIPALVIFGISNTSVVFWVTYAIILVAFAAQLFATIPAFRDASGQRLFLNIPTVKLSANSLVGVTVVGLIAMLLSALPDFTKEGENAFLDIIIMVASVIMMLICIILAVTGFIKVLKVKVAADVIEERNVEVKVKTLTMRTLIVEAEGIVSLATDEETKNAARRVYEALRYSDPMSNSALADDESQISAKLNVFKSAVINNNTNDIDTLAKSLECMIELRNKKCMILK